MESLSELSIDDNNGEAKGKEENPNSNPNQMTKNSTKPNPTPIIVVIMGATGSGKSRLAIDLASHFPIEIINADSMQVYQGLDVLTNKVPLQEQKGVPHHLLGTISPNVEFTAKDFRDDAILVKKHLATNKNPMNIIFRMLVFLVVDGQVIKVDQFPISLIDDILSRNRLPVIVGGTNYYIQSLVSPFLLNDSVEDMDESCSRELPGDKQPDSDIEFQRGSLNYNFDCLKEIDPLAANRIHPNDHRKINQYLSLYARSGVLPSKLLQGKAMENWGRVDNFRYSCCFICVDASLPVLDEYVGRRVDCMIAAGLLNEVYDIYNCNADYTRGLRQAIGVREFEEFLRLYLCEYQNGKDTDLTEVPHLHMSTNKSDKMLKEGMSAILSSSTENQLKLVLAEAIGKVKLNTQRLIRRQKRRINRLQTLFGWNIHFVDSTQSLLCFSDTLWSAYVVEPSVKIIRSYLNEDKNLLSNSETSNGTEGLKLNQRDLWTQHICKACGDRVLRGAYEWEQHRQGRGHRKRISRLRKSGILCADE